MDATSTSHQTGVPERSGEMSGTVDLTSNRFMFTTLGGAGVRRWNVAIVAAYCLDWPTSSAWKPAIRSESRYTEYSVLHTYQW